jgi:geranylgeranylglycerol-phosphate geranylgeranyltransferase
MKNTLLGLLRLSRPDLSFASGVCVVLGQLLAIGHLPAMWVIIAGFFSVTCTSAAILVMNDYLDVATDMVNAPHRPIPSGMVNKTMAGYFIGLLFAAGLVLGFTLSYSALAVVALLSVVGVLYNRLFKQSGILGNIMVSFSVGMTFVYGGITAGNPAAKAVLFFAIVRAMVDLGEEIAADTMDMEGDKLIHSKSIAIRYGKENAVNISTGIFGAIILFTVIPFIFGWFNRWYVIPFSLLDMVIIIAVVKFRGAEGGSGRKYIKWIYRSGTVTLLIFLIMKLAGV